MGQRGRKRIEDKHPELLKMLGVQSDKELAEQFGCTPVTIGNARRRAGLPYHRSPANRTHHPRHGRGREGSPHGCRSPPSQCAGGW